MGVAKRCMGLWLLLLTTIMCLRLRRFAWRHLWLIGRSSWLLGEEDIDEIFAFITSDIVEVLRFVIIEAVWSTFTSSPQQKTSWQKEVYSSHPLRLISCCEGLILLNKIEISRQCLSVWSKVNLTVLLISEQLK